MKVNSHTNNINSFVHSVNVHLYWFPLHLVITILVLPLVLFVPSIPGNSAMKTAETPLPPTPHTHPMHFIGRSISYDTVCTEHSTVNCAL
jgi:hypothetical protein